MVINLSKEDLKWLKNNHSNMIFNRKENIIKGVLYFNRSFEDISISDSYDIKILLEPKEGYMIPQVLENNSSKIKQGISLLNSQMCHLNSDGTVCLCYMGDDKKYFLNGFKLDIFFEKILEPILYYFSYCFKYKKEPWPSHAHGNFIHLERYGNNEISLIELKKYFKEDQLLKFSKEKGHSSLFCGDGNKIRNCYPLIYKAIYRLKKELK